VTCAGDVLRVLGIDPPPPKAPPAFEPRLELVRAIVADAAATADEVAQATGQSARVVAAALGELELLGVVEEVDGVYRALAQL
jgi:predicted Rossmann fold nucleotide-binding protein DprA/Smf involved in DNA uptake